LITKIIVGVSGQNAILVYNMEQNQWMEISRPIMENTKLMLPQICVCHSCLLMVEVMSSRFLMTRISIWKLPKFGGLWSKIASMPDKLLKEVMNISGKLSIFLVMYNSLFSQLCNCKSKLQNLKTIIL
jgi:hypothetical protein